MCICINLKEEVISYLILLSHHVDQTGLQIVAWVEPAQIARVHFASIQLRIASLGLSLSDGFDSCLVECLASAVETPGG